MYDEDISTETIPADVEQEAPETETPAAVEDETGNAPQESKAEEERLFTQADINKAVKDRLARERKQTDALRSAWKALENKGYIRRGATPEEVIEALEQAQIDELAETNPVEAARLEAQRMAKAEALDVRIDAAAERLAEKDPLFAELADPDVLESLRPMARMLGGDVKSAYLAKFGDAYAKRLAKQTEAKAMARLAEKSSRKVESGDGGGEAEKLGLNADELAVARMMGMDPKEYKALKEATDFGKYQKMKRK